MEKTVDLLMALSKANDDVNVLQDKTDEFNVFKVLGIENKEVILCRLIKELLDPKGAHKQGVYPFKKFFEKILKVNISEAELEKSDIIVKTEESIDNKRRVDLIVFINNNVYPIEVKIWADDQKSQLYDYYHYYKKSNKHIDKIYYLSPIGKKPSEKSKLYLPENAYKCISFEEIFDWLEDIKPKNMCNLKTTIEQFKEIIIEMIAENKKLQQLREILNVEDVKNYKTNEMLKGAITLLNNKENLVREIMQNYLEDRIYVGDDNKYSVLRVSKKDEEMQALLKIVENNTDKTLAWICVSSNLYIAAKNVKKNEEWKNEGNEYFWQYIHPNGNNQKFPLKKLDCIFEFNNSIDINKYLDDIVVE